MIETMKKILTISILLSALTLTGCKDFLVQEPITSQSTDQLMSTYNGLNNAVAGAYSPLATNYWYGGLYFLLDADTRAGIAAWPLSSDFQSGRMQTGFTLNYNENSTNGPWTYAYYVIFAANSVIEQLEANSASLVSSIVTQQDLDNIKAESLTLRALGHFDLLRVYSRNDYPELGVPVITVPQESTDQPARNTIAEVYAQIEKDLTDAEALISPDYVRSGVADANATINIWTIRALLARVYLYDATFSGDASKYQLAADYATQVIESGKYTMWKADEYSTVWGNDVGGGEIIFETYQVQANSYDAYWEAPTHMTNPNGYADVCASPLILKAFEPGDVRGAQAGVRDKNEDGQMYCTDTDEKSGDYWPMKYPGKGLGNVTGTPDQNNCVIIRLSEMYLIRAEAMLNGASVAGATAMSDINTIRTNRNATAFTANPVLDDIVEEYMLEFCFEGQYWYTMARLVTAGKINYGITYTTDRTEAQRRGTAGIDTDDRFWALPISRTERDVNPNLEQTPGY